MAGDEFQINPLKSRAASLSVVSNAVLVLVKLSVGAAIGSVAIMSEAMHSGVDLLAALIALFAVRESAKPADQEHPYGHGKFENFSGTLEALLIFVAAAWIIWGAIEKIIHPGRVVDVGLGVVIMGISALVNLVVSQYLFRVAKRADSVALEADAWHLSTDVYTSAGVSVALLIMWGGGILAPDLNLSWIDSVAAIAVAVLILRAAWHLTLKAARDLLDIALPAEEEEWIRSQLLSISPLICGIHRLRTRKAGGQRFIDLHLVLDPSMSLLEASRLADMVADAIRTRFRDASVTIHQEPCRSLAPGDKSNCKDHCRPGCLMP